MKKENLDLSLKKGCPNVLKKAVKKEQNETKAWGKSPGGPYPWRKQ